MDPNNNSNQTTQAPLNPSGSVTSDLTVNKSEVPQLASKKGKSMILAIILLIVSFLCGLMLAAWYFRAFS